MAKRSKRHGKGDDGTATPLDPAACAHLLNVSRETIHLFEEYLTLLAEWQKAINLVADSTLTDPWRRHILDCGQICDLIPARARRLVDIGSGAGLPGLVLAIMGSERDNLPDIHLVESDSKKCAFLRTAIRQLGVSATVHETRAEEMPDEPFDVVTARA
ncbi:MAG: 16S rRNA (guanine(527)-N(7))-methyltransferase RsmG, partial [Alphaproteobacteria bacterium]